MSKRIGFLAFLIVTLVAAFAWAADPAAPLTGIHVADQVFAYLGAASTILLILANVLPKDWAVTQLLARFGADLRGINSLTPTERSVRQAAARAAGLLIFCFVAARTFTACTPKEIQAANQAVDIANAVCELAGSQDDPAWVQFACKNLDQNGAPVQFTARAPRGKPLGRLEVCPAVAK